MFRSPDFAWRISANRTKEMCFYSIHFFIIQESNNRVKFGKKHRIAYRRTRERGCWKPRVLINPIDPCLPMMYSDFDMAIAADFFLFLRAGKKIRFVGDDFLVFVFLLLLLFSFVALIRDTTTGARRSRDFDVGAPIDFNQRGSC